MISKNPTGQRPGRAVVAMVCVLTLVFAALFVHPPDAAAQNVDVIADALESDGYFLESGAFGDASDFEDLVDEANSSANQWYFVSMSSSVSDDFADELRDIVSPSGNVIVYYIDNDGFEVVQFASNASEVIEDSSLAAFDRNDWTDPEDFMDDVVRDFDELSDTFDPAESAGSTSTNTTSNDSGGGRIWPWLAVPAVLIGGGIWFSGRRRRNKEAEEDLESAQKIRAELQTELDELANDVIVLSSAVDLSENDEAINHYRQATATYTAISDEIPDAEQLETLNKADLKQLSELGARVVHARWQMDAAEAIIAGEPVPDKPEIAVPVVETPAPQAPARLPRNLERRQPRPRVPYSRSRRRSGGGLLDILIAGSGMLGGNRRASRSRRSSGGFGSMFGTGSQRTQNRSGSRSSRSRSTRTSSRGPRSGGGVFGGGSSTRRSSSSRRSTSRRRSRSSNSRRRSRASSSRRSTSRRRRR